MKKIICLAASLLALNLALVFGQQTPAETDSAPTLTKFNLDFPGGTPVKLVKAIEKATGKPLNAIIPTEDVDIQLPPLKMNGVVAPQLFNALKAASRKTVAVQMQMFGNSYSQATTDYGFESSDHPITDTSIWYFHVDKPSLPPVVPTETICRFYNLDPYLNRSFTVDDITTAIQTGWKMAGITSPPKLEYHKETKLLIACGEPSELQIIRDVLNTLPQAKYGPTLSTQIEQLQNQVELLQKQLKHDELNVLREKNSASQPEKSGK